MHRSEYVRRWRYSAGRRRHRGQGRLSWQRLGDGGSGGGRRVIGVRGGIVAEIDGFLLDEASLGLTTLFHYLRTNIGKL